MRDLELWRRIARGGATAADLAPLAAWTLARRAAHLGTIAPLVEHADPSVRAAALAALTGVRGVPGVRALVAALGDPEPAVWGAALAALRETARDAPMRYVHALFHPRVEVRRAALADVPRNAVEAAAYLRADADPACAALAAALPWPDHPLSLAFDLHRVGALASDELIKLVASSAPTDLRRFFETERGRDAETVEAYFAAAETAAVLPIATGEDVLDSLARALGEAAQPDRAAETVLDALMPRRNVPVVRRYAAALLSRIARSGGDAVAPARAVVMSCAAVEPRVLGLPGFPRELGEHAAAGLVRYKWPHKPAVKQVQQLLAVPWIRDDLAIAAAVAGLFASRRLGRLARALGEPRILETLAATGRGWEEICRLPAEKPPLELRWLSVIERTRPERHAELAGQALAVFAGPRLEAFVEQMQRKNRHAAFLALARTAIDPDDARIAAAARLLGPRIDRTQAAEILIALLAPAEVDRGIRLALVFARALTDKQLAAAARLIDDAAAARFIVVLDGFDALPRDREIALAQVLADRPHPELQAWAARVLRVVVATPAVPLPAVRARRALDGAQRDAIATCTDRELEAALAPALLAPVTGLAAALALRKAAPSVAACAALLGCADPLDDVAVQLDRFALHTDRFGDELDNAAIATWRTGVELPPLAHARLWRWEAHTVALQRFVVRAGGMHRAFGGALALEGVLAAQTLCRGLAELLMFARYRDRTWFLAEGTAELAALAAAHVDDPIKGRSAARVVVALVEGGAAPLHTVKQALLDKVADADAPTRELLSRLVRMEGMPEPPRPTVAPPGGDVLATIRASRDLDELVAWCRDPRTSVVQEAVLVLLTLGDPGQLRLGALLAEVGALLAPLPILRSVVLWDNAGALAAARALAAAAGLPPEWQFHLCMGLGDTARAIAAVQAPDAAWFRRSDWDALIAAADPMTCALALVAAPHHHAYARSLEVLMGGAWHGEPRVPDALRRFLEVDAARPIELRRGVARRLALDHGDLTGLPILVEEMLDEGAPQTGLSHLSVASGSEVARAIVDAALLGGHTACTEKRMWELLERLARNRIVAPEELPGLHARILEGASTSLVRRNAATMVVGDALAHDRLTRIAEVFAWGVRRGVELTGRVMRIHLTSAEKDLGHTYLSEGRIFVTPLPMLREEAHGRDIVEGLILHELGHHAYHRGEVAEALWKQAHAEGIGHLLNLVADEHLERNLRAVDRGYGDRLKRLDAYAFHHAPQELRVKLLLEALRSGTARALAAIELGVAFDEASVRLRRGAVLTELDRAGHPLARFARALRMGLGNRHDDPLTAAALALCGKDLKKLDMRGLYDLTRRLAAMFGGATAIARVFGGAEGLELGEKERDLDVHGSGLDDDILQREVERILDPRRTTPGGKRGPRDRLQINVGPDEEFDKIHTVTRVRGDAGEHRQLATETHRHSVRLRAHLDDLGLRWEPTKARLKGHALDRGRLRALVTRGDPKILIARAPVRRTDLFLGTLIDCSGSMQAGQNIERARKFGVMIAEAVRSLPGVEARFFGFTDSVIFDAGDAKDCDVTALKAGGGNNDAAALLHVANVAAASPKRARVLVMISDGLPTECSVTALRGLVTTLTKRRGMVCAQVAVRRLEEQCFPNYVVLDDGSIDVAVARFGRMIADLARKVLR